MNDTPDSRAEYGTVLDIPVFISERVEPGAMLTFSMRFEPTEEDTNRWVIWSVKVASLSEYSQVGPLSSRARRG